MTTLADVSVDTAGPVLRTGGGGGRAPLFTVVGFDGSDPSRLALETAADLIRGRSGHLEVVYVSHLSGCVALSAPAVVEARLTFEQAAMELEDEVRAILDDREPRWHFQQRSGAVARELVAAATALRRQHGPAATIVIIVGPSEHFPHQVVGAVSVALARRARFPVLVA